MGTIFSHDKLLASQHPSSVTGVRISQDDVWLAHLEWLAHLAQRATQAMLSPNGMHFVSVR